MESHGRSVAGEWWVYAIPLCNGRAYYLSNNPCIGNTWALYIIATALVLGVVYAVIMKWLSSSGCAWIEKKKDGNVFIPGPRGWPIIGSLVEMSGGHAHRKLTELARRYEAKKLMALSLGSTPVVITSDPNIARELLNSPHFADRPLKQSAQELMFGRAIGFASGGEYWRMLRRISAAHLFPPRRIAAHEPGRQADCLRMLGDISDDYAERGAVTVRGHLQSAALNNILGSVFGRIFDVRADSAELKNLWEMVDEGFELLGAFNWGDHLPCLRPLDPLRIHRRCARLVQRVRAFVKDIIDQHRRGEVVNDAADSDFVDALLSLQGHDKIDDEDMIAVLWEMIFRGTDTIALVIEWTMAELVLKQEIQAKAQAELEAVVGRHGSVRDENIARLPYLQAVVKESLRMHPPGPLLSWARLCTDDVELGKGMHVPAGTTAMVNMWSITHDPEIWEAPYEFRPKRFIECDIDVRGNELKLAPFGGGRRVCPGKGLALSIVNLWVAKLLHHYKWLPCPQHPVDLTDILKLSCQMATPLTAVPLTRIPFRPELCYYYLRSADL